MLADAFFSFAHFAAIVMLVGALFGETYLLRLPVTAQTIPLLSRIDRLYGISALTVVAAGFCRVYLGLKDESFYFSSHAFWGKMAVFVAIGLLSIPPTMKFLRWNKAAKADASFTPPAAEVKAVQMQVRIQTMLLALVIVFAVLMARGIG